MLLRSMRLFVGPEGKQAALKCAVVAHRFSGEGLEFAPMPAGACQCAARLFSRDVLRARVRDVGGAAGIRTRA
jgi:hypothetical protein